MYGATASVSVSAGRMNRSICCTIGTLESTREVAGSILNTWVANRRMRKRPITNSGSAAIARLPTVTLPSNLESRRNAVREPRSSETGTLTRAATNTRMKELSTRRPMRLVTGEPCASESPRSPVSTPPSQSKYCEATGLLSPSCSLSAS